MAGFFGFFNYAKPGKGISKNEPQKKRFFLFFDMYFRNFWRLIKLNLLYVLFCIPIVTIGPATVAMVKITNYYCDGKPVFLWSDFWDAFKANFKQGFFLGLLNAGLAYALITSLIFYASNLSKGILYYVLFAVAMICTLLFVFSTMYSYLLCATVHVTFIGLLKDSYLLGILSVGTNFLTLFFAALMLFPVAWFFPLTIPVLLVFPMSSIAFLTSFNSFRKIYRFVVKPYYDSTGEENPYEPEEDEEEGMIFTDASDTEKPVAPQPTSRGNKKIS